MQEALSTYRTTDSFFGHPYIDVDETRGAPVPHRYVHGGFTDTATRFSLYFPAGSGRRLFQFLEGGYGGSENTAASGRDFFGGLRYAASRGGFFAESNQGHIGAELCPKGGDDATIYAYRASAECARLAKHLAAAVYGAPPTHAYVFGGSGGGHRTLCCMEHADDGVWDGGVASVVGAPDTFRGYSAMNNARRSLGDRFDQVVDAVEPGGSGDPFAGLATDQREALADLYAAGFPRRAERSVPEGLNAGTSLWAWNADALVAGQAEYFQAFWTKPGHAGADGLLAEHVIDAKVTVTRTFTPQDAAGYRLGGFGRLLLTAPPDKKVGIQVSEDFPHGPEGSRLTILSGAAAGRILYCTSSADGLMVGSSIAEAQTLLFDGVEEGDEVHIDNRDYLAYCLYYRHHLPPATTGGRLCIDGRPVYPQHPLMSAHDFSSAVFGPLERTGALRHPVILLQHTHDTSGWPAGAIDCADRVREHLGDSTDDRFRLWWIEQAEHIPASFIPTGSEPAPTTRLIDYGGAHEAALDAMVGWVEEGVAPALMDGYIYSREEGSLTLAPTASQRGGIQAVVDVTADGAARADVAAGTDVTFEVRAEVPAGAGGIVEVAWDFEGAGAWPEVLSPLPASAVRLRATHHFEHPGTYFPAVRVTSNASSDPADAHARVINLGRCRVVVR